MYVSTHIKAETPTRQVIPHRGKAKIYLGANRDGSFHTLP
jgi:hypothetical protein